MAPRLPRQMLAVLASALVMAGALWAGLTNDGRSAVEVTADDAEDLALAVPTPVSAATPAESARPLPLITVPDPTPPTSAVQPAHTTGTAAPAPPAPVVELAPAGVVPTGEDLAPGTYHEQADTANFVVLPAGTPGIAGSATSLGNGAERLRFDVVVAGDGTFTARMVNVSGRTMRFTGGLRVAAEVTLDGRPWRTLDLVDVTTTTLAPGEQASVTTTFSFDQPGQYSAWGSTDVQIV